MAIGLSDESSFLSPPNMSLTDAGDPNPNRFALDASSQFVELTLQNDNNFNQYHDLLWCTPVATSVSGLRETDYPNLKDFAATMKSVNHISGLTNIPLPPALEEQFNHMQSSCDMGLFPEINRAWLTIDSNLFLWAYDNGQDIAFYDRITETIIGVGLIKPKKGLFKEHITYLLCLTTAEEIQLLGVMASDADDFANIHIILEPMFKFPSDNVRFSVVAGTDLGRVFLGGKDGNLVECVYNQEDGWFVKKSYKVNHSSSSLTAFLPSFLNFSSDDSIEQIEVDNSRNILFTRTEKGTIEVYDLGLNGMETYKVASLSASCIIQQAANVARTVDPGNFRSIVQINTIEESESTVINLMAVTEAGVRMYFTTSRGSDNTRPTTLSLIHIRLPPGFSASSGFQKPSRVHLSHHRRGTTIMLSPQNQERDMLWLLTNDPFPFCRELVEISTAVPLGSRVWKMVEERKKQIVQPFNCIRLIGNRPVGLEPPLLVTQDMEEPRKFVLLTSQGINLVYKPRPVDHLKKILSDHQGFDNEAVRGFFVLYGEEQASCCAISLACCQTSAQDRQIAEWATLAFFRFTKESETAAANVTLNQPITSQQQMSTPINQFSRPQVTSPASPLCFSPQSMPSNLDNMEVTYQSGDSNQVWSCRHRSLYLFFSRIVRPVWNYGVVVTQPGSPPATDVITSSVNSLELIVYIEKLKNLKTFIQKHHPLRNPMNAMNHFPRTVREREALSLSNLVVLIESTLEVLGLWKILNDHHFYSFATQLPIDTLNRLKNSTFKELIINGQDLCGRLASCLVQKFIDDNDTTDAISTRLNEACPSVFKQENALFAKAQEMINKAKILTNPEEKDEQIEEAAKLFTRIGARIPLQTACGLLQTVGAYDHLIRLCITTAGLKDPQNQGLLYYKNNEPSSDFTGSTLFSARMDCYRVLLECLQELIDRSKMTVHPNRASPSLTDRRTFADQFTREESANIANYIIEESLKTSDELYHAACFEWLFKHQLTDRLLQIKSPFLEDYLKKKIQSGESSSALMDLLWMYYERNGHHRAAAEILIKLAERSGPDADLNERRQYLSRAIVCMKSQNSLGLSEKDTKHAGEFLHELEEKMDVARLQSGILETLKTIPNASNAVAELESGLYDITQLYEKADQFDLAEHQLHIIHVANHEDPVLIGGFWKKILETEIQRSPDSRSARIAIESKLRELARLYVPSEKYFPLPLLIETLESKGSNLNYGEVTWLADALIKIGFPFPLLVDNYHCIYRTTGGRFTWPSKEIQLLTIIHHLMYQCASASNPVDR
jgi:nuclear pore complex protein Nup155